MSRKFWVLALITFVNALSSTVLIPVIFVYARKFNLDNFQAGLLTSVYSIAQFFATPIIGALSDRFGRKPLLAISLAGTIIANLLAAFAPNAIFLFLGRIVDGLTGGNNSVAQAIVTDLATGKEQTKVFGTLSAAFSLGIIIGPVISLSIQGFGLDKVFLVSASFATLAFILTIFTLQETIQTKVNKPILGLFTTGIEDLARGLTFPKTNIIFIINFLTSIIFSLLAFAFQPFLIEKIGTTAQTISLIFTMFGVIGLISQAFLVKPITNNFNLINVMFAALVVRAACMFLMPNFPNLVVFVILAMVINITGTLVQPVISTLLSLTSKSNQGEIMGLNSSYSSAASALGPILGGLLAQQSITLAFYVGGIIGILTLAYIFVQKPKLQTIEDLATEENTHAFPQIASAQHKHSF